MLLKMDIGKRVSNDGYKPSGSCPKGNTLALVTMRAKQCVNNGVNPPTLIISRSNCLICKILHYLAGLIIMS